VITFEPGKKTTSASLGIPQDYTDKVMKSVKANIEVMANTGAMTTQVMQAVCDDCDPVRPAEFFLIGLFLGAALTEK
jgi:hypothetical protein